MASDDLLNEPAEFLVDNIDLLPQGRVLDIAMGSGRNAIYLARHGYEVEGVDVAPEAVASAVAAAKRLGVTMRVQVADLERDYRIAERAYDVIMVFNYLQRSLIPAIKAGLRRGGVVIYETFIVDQARFGKPRNPDHLLEHNELLEMFRDLRCLRYHEGTVGNRRAIAGIIAAKV